MNRIEPLSEFQEADTPQSIQRTGMRLHRCELFNWGTFNGRVWGLDLGGQNTLLTGDIGSGKSTLVDAITTLLVPAQRITYNKAAGAEAKERDLRSYVLGYYKSEKGDSGLSARPVALREQQNAYSVILGQFQNEGFEQQVTLAQVFSFKEAHGQPSRFYVIADTCLNITEHFTGFGPDINALRKRLRAMPHVEVHDSFPPYGAAFRRRFGIDNEQALDLFYQTVSMKSVGNLTDFVRQHMLESFPVAQRIQSLITHFDDLNRSHEAVLKAKRQIERLTPLVADCDQYAGLAGEILVLRSCREALPTHYASEERVADLLDRLGKQASAQYIRTKLPEGIRMRSGDLGEILATEYVAEQTSFSVPIKRLRWKDERSMAMRGDDVLAIRIDQDEPTLQFMKAETKSRAALASAVVEQARTALNKHDGLPSPHALAYVADRLREAGEIALVNAIDDAQLKDGIQPKQVEHLLFIFCGNSPLNMLRTDLTEYSGPITQSSVGLRVVTHQQFIKDVYSKVIADGDDD